MSRCNNSISLGTLLRVGAAFVVFALLLIAQTTTAQPAPTINYQGKLLDSASVTVPDGEYNMRFYLYNTTGGATTTAIWDEERVGGDQVTVDNGLFSVMLGAVDSLSGVDFNQTLYLGVEIGGTGSPGWDGEMAPRKILGSVPAAFEAGNATTFNNLATTSFLRSDQDDTASGLLTFTGGFISSASSTIDRLTTGTTTITTLDIGGEEITSLTGTGLTNTSGTLTVATSTLGLGDGSFLGLTDTPGSFTANRLLFTNAAGDAVTDSAGLTYDDTTGNVGIGTTGPYSNLHVSDGETSGLSSIKGDGIVVTGNPVARIYFEATNASAGNRVMGIHYDSNENLEIGSLSDNGGSWDVKSVASFNRDGNVGIGTTTPSEKLSVSGNIKGSGVLNIDGTGDSYIQGNVGIGTTVTGSKLSVNGGISAGTYSATAAPSNGMIISGNVGIGTTAPTAKLQINGGGFALKGGTSNDVVRPALGAGFGGLINGEIWAYSAGSPTHASGLLRLSAGGGTSVLNKSWIDISGYSSIPDARKNIVFGTGGSERVRITETGNVGIGTTAPSLFKLQVAGNVGPNADNTYTLGAIGSDWECVYYQGGSLGTCASDRNLKTNITDLTYSEDDNSTLEKLSRLQVRSFEYKEARGDAYNGLIAQEVREAGLDALVTERPNGYLAVKYGDLQWVIVEAIQEMWSQVQEYFTRTEQLEAEVETLKTRLEALESTDSNTSAGSADNDEPEAEPEENLDDEPAGDDSADDADTEDTATDDDEDVSESTADTAPEEGEADEATAPIGDEDSEEEADTDTESADEDLSEEDTAGDEPADGTDPITDDTTEETEDTTSPESTPDTTPESSPET